MNTALSLLSSVSPSSRAPRVSILPPRLRGRRIGLAAAFFGTALLTSAEHQPTLLYEIRGERPQDFPGLGLYNVGDQNQDGIDDFFAGTLSVSNGDWSFRHARVYDGRNGNVLLDLPKPQSFDPSMFFGRWFSYNFARIKDVDGDGAPDFAVADQRRQVTDFVVIYSSSGRIIREHPAPAELTLAVCALGDLDGDGAGDYSIGRSNYDNRIVNAHSGATGEILWSYDFAWDPRTGSGGPSYWVTGNVGDVDGDSVPDLLFDWAPREEGHSVVVVSGASLQGSVDLASLPEESILGAYPGAGTNSYWNPVVGDLDGDTHPDILLAASYAYPNRDPSAPVTDMVRALSGKPDQAKRLRSILSVPARGLETVYSERPPNFFIDHASVIGDIDGDRQDDLLLSCPGFRSERPAAIWLVSSKTGEVRHAWETSESFPFQGNDTEVAVLSDLNGDGWREVALYDRKPLDREAPAQLGSGRIAVYSLGPGRSVPVGLAVRRDGGDVVLTWDEGLNDVNLEASPDLVRWRAVSGDLSGNRYVVPPGGPPQLFYRLRFTP